MTGTRPQSSSNSRELGCPTTASAVRSPWRQPLSEHGGLKDGLWRRHFFYCMILCISRIAVMCFKKKEKKRKRYVCKISVNYIRICRIKIKRVIFKGVDEMESIVKVSLYPRNYKDNLNRGPLIIQHKQYQRSLQHLLTSTSLMPLATYTVMYHKYSTLPLRLINLLFNFMEYFVSQRGCTYTAECFCQQICQVVFCSDFMYLDCP